MDPEEFVDIDQIRRKEFEEAFKFFDKDNKNTINVNDLKNIFKRIGHYPSSADLLEMMREVVDLKNEINMEEFLLLMRKRMKDVDTVEEVNEAFRFFDKEKSGLVSIEEMKRELIALGETMEPEDLQKMLEAADEDNDGYINYETLVKKIVNS
jgi:Ca2+-binding EF-hand superfamily protein